MKSIKKEKIHREGEKQRKKKTRKQESKKARKNQQGAVTVEQEISDVLVFC